MARIGGRLLNRALVHELASVQGVTQIGAATMDRLDRELKEWLQAGFARARGKAVTSRRRLTVAMVLRMVGKPDQLGLGLTESGGAR